MLKFSVFYFRKVERHKLQVNRERERWLDEFTVHMDENQLEEYRLEKVKKELLDR